MLSRRTVVVALAYGAGARAGPLNEMSPDAALINDLLAAGGDIMLEPRVYLLAGPGDILRATRGDFRLRGAPGTVIECSQTYDGQPQTDVALFSIAGHTQALANVTLEGLTFRFSRPFALRGEKPVIYVQQVRGFTMRDCTVENGTYGTFLRQVEGFTITGNTFRNQRADGLQGSNQGSRILGMTTKDGEVSDNTFTNTGDDGIAFGSQVGPAWSRCSNIQIHHNTVRDMHRQGGGIGLYGVGDAEVVENTIIRPASHGIAVVTDTNNDQMNNARIVVRRNTIRSDLRPTDMRRAAIFLGNRNSAAGHADEPGPMLKAADVADNAVDVTDRHGIWLEMPHRYGASRLPTDLSVTGNSLNYRGPRDRRYSAMHIDGAASLEIVRNSVTGFPAPDVLRRIAMLRRA